MTVPIPKYVQKFFWGDDLSELSWEIHRRYITKTLLEKGDQQAIRWLIQKVDRNTLKDQLESLDLSNKSDNFWRVYLS